MDIRATEDPESRKVTFVISDESLDRHGSVIKLSAWRLGNYKKNGIVAYMHETNSGWMDKPDPDFIIGKGRVWKEDGKLMGEVEFEPEEINPLAEKIFRKVQFGSLRTTSVGFMPKRGHRGNPDKDEDSGTWYFDEVELLEFSIVNIPSNPNAVRRSFQNFINTQTAPAEAPKDFGAKEGQPQNTKSESPDSGLPASDSEEPFPNPGEKDTPGEKTIPVGVLKARNWLTLHRIKNR